MDIEEARARLQGMLAELDRSMETLEPAGATPEHRGGPGTADAGLELADSERTNAIRGATQAQRQRVVEALERIDAGTYGHCTDCGAHLAGERLEARPEAARCVACQAKAEGRR